MRAMFLKPIHTMYIIDTNVLLDDPNVIYTFSDVEIVIPQGVLAELDKLKTMRTDQRLRFHGREISRILFQLAQHNVLTDGVELKSGARLRVDSFDPDLPVHESLKTKNIDDQILALVYQQTEKFKDRDVFLITSDLNMLLRCQSLGLKFRHFEEVYSPGLIRTVWTQVKLKSKTLVWFVPLVVAIGIVVFAYPRLGQDTGVPPEVFKNLTTEQIQYYKYEEILKDNPDDLDALGWFGDYYLNKRQYERSLDYYNRVLAIQPDDVIYRTKRGVDYYFNKDFNKAAADLKKVTTDQPNYAEAHFWLGMTNYYGFNESNAALAEFNIYLQIEPDGPRTRETLSQMDVIQAQLDKQSDGGG